MSGIKNEKIKLALKEYYQGLDYKEKDDLRSAQRHLVRALRLLEEAYRECVGVEKMIVIRLFENISRILKAIEDKF